MMIYRVRTLAAAAIVLFFCCVAFGQQLDVSRDDVVQFGYFADDGQWVKSGFGYRLAGGLYVVPFHVVVSSTAMAPVGSVDRDNARTMTELNLVSVDMNSDFAVLSTDEYDGMDIENGFVAPEVSVGDKLRLDVFASGLSQPISYTGSVTATGECIPFAGTMYTARMYGQHGDSGSPVTHVSTGALAGLVVAGLSEVEVVIVPLEKIMSQLVADNAQGSVVQRNSKTLHEWCLDATGVAASNFAMYYKNKQSDSRDISTIDETSLALQGANVATCLSVAYSHIVLLISMGKVEVGLDLVERWESASPANGGLSWLRAIVLDALGRREEAIAAYEVADEQLSNPFAAAELAVGLFASGEDPDRVVKLCRDAIEAHPSCAEPYRVLSAVALRSADYDAVKQIWNDIKKYDMRSETAFAICRSKFVRAEHGFVEQLVADCESMSPDSFFVHALRGQCSMAKGEFVEAARHFRRALGSPVESGLRAQHREYVYKLLVNASR